MNNRPYVSTRIRTSVVDVLVSATEPLAEKLSSTISVNEASRVRRAFQEVFPDYEVPSTEVILHLAILSLVLTDNKDIKTVAHDMGLHVDALDVKMMCDKIKPIVVHYRTLNGPQINGQIVNERNVERVIAKASEETQDE